MHGILGLFSANNLGAHSLFGFLESFSANLICMYCLAHKCDIQTKFHASDFERCIRGHIEECCKSLAEPSYNSAVTGVKNNCILNSLDYFHCTEQSAMDCMHDVLENIVPYEVSLIIGSLVNKHLITLAELNDAIFHFD